MKKKAILTFVSLYFIFTTIAYISLDKNLFKLAFVILTFTVALFLATIYFLITILRNDLSELNKKLTQTANNISRQIDHRIALSSEIALFPLPGFRGYAISPDAVNEIAFLIKKNRPNLILELGSGLSTILIANMLKNIGNGKLISIEHDKKYLEKTRDYLKIHGLNDFVELIYAPLEEIDLNGKKFIWYSLENLKNIKDVDLLIVDGPPGNVCEMARFPAMPVLYDRLSKNALVVLDDMVRKDEQEMLKRWVEMYQNIEYELVDTEKGLAILYISKL